MAINDNFILEISARLKKDGKELVSGLHNEIKRIEKETKLDLDINDEKINKYLEKLKSSLKEINGAMNNANIEANSTSFVKFVDVLKEGAQYSKEIANSLQIASKIKIDIDELNNNITAHNNKSKLSKNDKDLTIGELTNKRNLQSTRENQLSILKSMYKDYSKYDISKPLKNNVEKTIRELEKDVINVNVDIGNDEQVNKEIDKIKNNVSELIDELDKVEIKNLNKQNENNLKKQLKVNKEINKLTSDIIKNSNQKNVNDVRKNQIKEQRNELQELIKEQNVVKDNYNKINSSKNLSTIDDLKHTKEYEAFKKSQNTLDLDLAKRNAKLDDRYSNYSGFNKNEELYNKYKNSTYSKYANMYNDTIGKYEAKINEIKSSNVTNFDTSELTEYENKLKEILKILNDNDFKNPKIEFLLDDDADIDEAKNAMKNLLETKKGYIKESLKESTSNSNSNKNIVKMTASYRTADKQIKDVTYTFNKLTGAIIETRDASKSVALTSKFDTFGDKLSKKFGDLSTYLLSFASFYEVVNIVKQGFSIIKDLDTQLTEMEKVSNESLSNLKAYAKSSYDIAAEIGSTGKELQASTADYMRLGKSLQEASKLAQDTNILMNVSEFESIDKATESMISMTQAYQELDSMDIIDKLNLTGNNYSISTDELAQSLQKSSSALKTAKNDFDEAIALTVAGNSVVQDPDSVAAGIRTIALRMTGTDAAKKELEDLGEEADTVLTKSKLNDTLEMLTNIDSRGGISLLDDNGNYRSTAKVLMDLAERWQAIGEQDKKDGQNRQNALLESLAGKNRSNILASILNDPNLLKNVYNDVSTNYQGSAMKENEKHMQSIEGHLEKLRNTWQEFWASDNNREFVNNIIDLANGFLELANSIGGAKVALSVLFGLFARFKWKDQIGGFLSGLKDIFSEIYKTGNSTILTSSIGNSKIGKLFENNNNGNINKNISESITKGFDIYDLRSFEQPAEEAIEESTRKAVKEGAENGAKLGSVEASNGGLMNIAKFLFTTPVGLAITTIGTAFIAKSIYDSYINGLEEASNRVESSLSSFNTKKTELNQFKESIPDLAKEYDSLRKGVSYTGENLSLTNDEFQRYHEITSQIASTCPELINGYDSTGNAIVNLTNSLEDLNSAYDETLKKEALKSLKEGSIDDAKKSIEKQEVDSQKDYFNFVDDSGVNKFFKGGENSKKAGKVLDKYQKFINDNSDNKKLKKISSKLKLTKNQDRAGGAGVGIASNYMALSKSLAFDSKEYESTIKMLQEEAASTTDEDSKQIINSLIDYLQNTVTNFKNEFDQMKDRMITRIQTNNKYYDLDGNQRTQFDAFVQNLNEEDYYKYEGKKVENLFNKYYEYVKGSYGSENISTLSNWQSLLTGSNGTIAENEKKIQEAKNSLMKGLGLTEETVNNKFNIDTTILDKEKEKLIKFYSDVNTEAEKNEDKHNKNVVKKYKQSTDQKKKLINEFNKNLSGEELKNIANNIDNIDIDKVLNDYETKYKKFYNNRDKFISDYLNSFKNVEPTYLGDNKSFSDLESNVSSYSSMLSQLNNIGNDNVTITDEMATTLKGYGDEFSNYIQKSSDGVTSIITNTEAVKELIKQKQKDASIDARNSKNQAIQNYKNTTDTLVDLTNQLEKTADSEGNLDESILKNIQSTESQLNVLKRNIQYYEQLEVKLLGATNAFDAYNLAVQQDESQNAYSTATSMINTLKDGFETGRLGTEAFKASIQGLLSDSAFNNIMNTENLDNRYNMMKEKYDKLKTYFTTDSNGNTTTKGIQNFVNDAYSKGLFTSNNLNNFDIADNVNIDSFVEKLDYSKETIYAIFEQIKSFDFSWEDSPFDKLMEDDGFGKASKSIEDYTDKINKNNKAREELLLQRSRLDKTKNKEEWNTLTKQIDKYSKSITKQQSEQKKIYNSNSENVMSYIEVNKQISEQQTNVDILNKKLKEYKTAYATNSKINGKTITKKDIEKLELDTKEAEEKLGKLLNKKSKLGEPTKVNLTLAKEKFEKDLEELKNQKIEIESEIKTNIADATIFKGENLLIGGLNLDVDKKNLLEKTNSEIKKVENNIKEIDLKLGIEAETSGSYDTTVADVKADKKELGKDVKFKVKADLGKVNDDLKKVKKNQDKIKKTLNVTTTHTVIERTVKQEGGAKAAKTAIETIGVEGDGVLNRHWRPKEPKAFGQNNSKSVFNYFGKAYANGKLGNISSHTSGNTLVGELGAETVVDPWNGTYKVVGIHGAEFVNIPKDAIVFNHKQTEELQKTGKIKSRGAIVSNASGYMQGFAKASPYKNLSGEAYADKSRQNINIITSSNSKKNNTSKSNSSKSKSKTTPESDSSSSSKETKNLLDDLFDWIEIKLQRISDKTQKYMTLAENAISKTVKEAEYKYAISSTKSEITNNQAASKKYKSYANSLITKAKKNGVKNASTYAKKVRDGSISLQSISDEKTLDFINSYKEMYDKAKECDSAVLSLTAQLSDLAESFYNLPTEYAEKKIEKFSDEMDVLSAKLDVARTYENKNAIIDKQTKLQEKIKKANQTASKNTEKNLKSAKGKLDSTKDSALKGLNSKQKKAIVAKVKSGEEVHISPKYSATLQSAIANYNKALEANRIASNNAQKASAEYTKVLRDNTNAKYENITAYYDSKKAISDSHISKNDAKLEYRTAMGYSNTSKAQKGIIENKIKYEQEKLDYVNSERKKYDAAKLKAEYDSGKLSKEDYYNKLQRIQELEEEYYTTKTNLANLNEEIKNLKITHLDYVINGISRALEKFQNIISIKEAKNEDIDESLYRDQIKQNENKIPILYEQYKEYEEQQKLYAIESEKYQELEDKKASLTNEIANAITENERLKDTIHELRFKKATEANDVLNTTIDDVEHLRDLLSDDKLIDDNGKFTESGLANITLIGKQMEASKKKIVNYRYMLEKLTESYENGNLSLEEYNEQSKQYVELIQDSVKAVDNYRSALIDMYKQQLEAENDTLQKNIDLRKQSLEAKKRCVKMPVFI